MTSPPGGQAIFFFGDGEAEGGKEQRELLGGKGANLAEMTRLGVPVPPGFTITTEVCRHYLRERAYPDGFRNELHASLERLERATGKTFGRGPEPLLLSVRSGAAVSMPGMMDTILNLGLNHATVKALAGQAGDERFGFDAYRRLIQMYGSVVLDVPASRFEDALEEIKLARGAAGDTDLGAEALQEAVHRFKEIVHAATGNPFPAEPGEQLWGAIEAVFDSWDNPRAVHYRRVGGIPPDLGTAVSVMAMVFGNLGDDSGTGVLFTRDPATGERTLFGEFLVNAQGEDVVAGVRDPLPIAKMEQLLPGPFRKLEEVRERLEGHYRDLQDLEFTVEQGRLYLLQTRTAKRSALAAVRSAVEMVDEGLISREEAVLRVDPGQLEQLLHPSIDPGARVDVLTTGLPASPGAASGRVVFNPDEAARRGAGGEEVILVRRETSPEDFHGMVAAQAILTARGGMTSHAAVVARGMGKCCVAGATEIRVDEAYGRFSVAEVTVEAGEWITLDGSTGRVILGKVPTTRAELSKHFQRLMEWADDTRALGVRTNADTPRDAAEARSFGAEGIGLCRTEHMFFEEGRIDTVREMILAGDDETRRDALERLLPMQREDFVGIFRAMDGLPVTIRLLDPPLHEFLPYGAAEIKGLSRKTGRGTVELRALVERHRESNPMLGHRGVRLGISYPEITRMQVRAIVEAAVAVCREGVEVKPEIMVPLVATAKEFSLQRELIREVAGEVLAGAGVEIPYLIGTMIELPRAALVAGEIAAEADFFSFGTNDLTQTTLGLSRDDAGGFLARYLELGVFDRDPFRTIDRQGVGALVELGVRAGRERRPDLKVGVCGEHGGDPESVSFFHRLGLDYVSCSPYRVPVARLAAAQAALERC
ncbi:MAG: pyruvate, phosphate dikinase [Longimicrobiaceae bacterium]